MRRRKQASEDPNGYEETQLTETMKRCCLLKIPLDEVRGMDADWTRSNHLQVYCSLSQ